MSKPVVSTFPTRIVRGRIRPLESPFLGKTKGDMSPLANHLKHDLEAAEDRIYFLIEQFDPGEIDLEAVAESVQKTANMCRELLEQTRRLHEQATRAPRQRRR